MTFKGSISGGVIFSVILWFGLLGRPGGSLYAQDVPNGAGSLDTGFFAAMGVSPSWNGTPSVQRIVVQPDGNLLICGGFDHVQGFPRGGIARLMAGGSLDRSFVPPAEVVSDFVLEPDGKIVVAATYTGLVRLDIDGTPDPTFDGKIDGGATAVMRLPEGEFLAGIHIDDDSTNPAPGFTVALFDAQGIRSERWSTQYRSSSSVSFILLAPDNQRIVVDGVAELALDNSGNNFRYLTNALPSDFHAACGVFQPDGKLLLGRTVSWGEVYNTNSTVKSALVRLNTDGSVDSSFSSDMSIGVSGLEGGLQQIKIDAIALQPDGKILIGGFFTRVNGQPRSLVARLLPNGVLDAEFVPDLAVNPGSDIDALETVSAMALAKDGGLLIGGVLSRINGLECRSLARLHTSSETSGGILKFSQGAYYAWETNGTMEVSVQRLGPTDRAVSVIYDAPDLYSDIPVPGPQRGTLFFTPGENVKTITLPIHDNLLLDGNHSFHLVLSNPGGGAVTTGTPETKISIFDDEQVGRPGSVDLNYPPLNLDGVVYNVTLLAVETDGSTLVAVQYTTNYWVYHSIVLRLSSSGAIDPNFHNETDQAITYAYPDSTSGKILIAGGFSMVNGQACTNVARLNHDGTLDTTFQVAADQWTSGAIVETDGKIVIYGYFDLVNNVPRRQVARLNPDGSVDPQFDTSALGWIGTLNGIASQADGKILLCGYFKQINGVSLTNLARLNSDGSLDASFVSTAFDGDPLIHYLLCQPDGKLLVSGYFRLEDGISATVVRLLSDGSIDNTFRAETPASAHGQPLLLQADGKIIVDGKWRLNSDGSRDYGYFTGDDATTVNSAVLLQNGDLLVTGGFPTFEQWPRPHLARLRGGDALAYGFFEFVESQINVNENAGPAVLHLRRVGATNETATVDFATADLSAKAGVDHNAVSGSFIFEPGELEKPISIPIIPNGIYQGDRSFNVVLRDTTSGVRSISNPITQVTIVEDDPGLTFSQTNYWVPGESIGTNGYAWRLDYVRRHGSLETPLTVQCQLIAGTAVAGLDFVATNLTLQFLPQQSEISVQVPLLRNEQAVEDRTLFLALKNPDPNVSLATDATAVFTIVGKPRAAGFVPGGSVFNKSGGLSLLCDMQPGQYLQIETSTNLLDWIYLGWVNREANQVQVPFVDPDAWKYTQRFYRFPQYPPSED
jgi:uncharacterized delta-60 repeat protein